LHTNYNPKYLDLKKEWWSKVDMFHKKTWS